jgi:hypothetical protein
LVCTTKKATISPALHFISKKLTNKSGFNAERFAVNIFEATLIAHSTEFDDTATLTLSLPF